jgi:hypothetical protein
MASVAEIVPSRQVARLARASEHHAVGRSLETGLLATTASF